MPRNIIKNITKITILTFIFFILFNLGNQALNAWWWNNDKKENVDNFTSIDNSGLNEVGVALNINIGTKFYEAGNIDKSLYNDILPLSIINSDPEKTKEILITKNLEAIKDYVNISKINIKGYLDSGDNRQETYDSLINQLKIRYKTGYANNKNLSVQINSLVTAIKEVDNSITNTKKNMSINMKTYNSKGLNKNIDDYILLKNQYTIYKTYIVFLTQFQKHYNTLNAYNRDVLTTLKLNESSIVNNTYVVIPNSGTKLIQNLNLIYDENSLGENINSENGLPIIDNSNTNTNSTGLLGDPFNLQNRDSETIKQSGGIDFGIDKYNLNKEGTN